MTNNIQYYFSLPAFSQTHLDMDLYKIDYSDGENSTDGKLTFCCRADGGAGEPVTLPTENPFILFKVNAV